MEAFGIQFSVQTAELALVVLVVGWAALMLLLFRIRERPDGAPTYRQRLRWAAGRLTLRVIGRPEDTARRLLYAGLFLGILVITMSAFLLVGANVGVSAESGPLLRSLARIVTDFRLYAAVAVLAMLVVRAAFWSILAGVTSRLTPYSKRAVQRYHSEVLSTDGTVRLIGTGRHSKDQLVAKLRRATNPESDIESEVPTVASKSPDSPTAALGGEPEAALLSEPHEGNSLAMLMLEDVDRLDAEIDRLDDKLDRVAFRAISTDTDGTVADYEQIFVEWDRALERRDRLYCEGMALLDEMGAHEDTSDDRSEATETALRDRDRGVESSDATDETTDPSDRLHQTVQTFLLDFATAANADDLVWRFLLPSATLAALTFVVLQGLWFNPVVYVAIGAGSFVGGGLYYATVKWRRRRRLDAARQAPETGGSGQTACLVKCIEIHGDSAPDAYVAWMGGHVYFSMDRTRFCKKIADRWWHRIHNRKVPPAIEERFAHNARMMLPTTYQTEFADSVEGRAAIQDELVDVVREAENPDGMVPKHALGEMVVKAGGRVGHDPDLIAEEYQHLHGAALAELDVSLEDAAGEQAELTVVHLRTGGVLHDLAEIRATFAAEFDPDAEARYPLPDVGDLAPQWDIEMGGFRPLEGATPDADATEGRDVSPVGAS